MTGCGCCIHCRCTGRCVLDRHDGGDVSPLPLQPPPPLPSSQLRKGVSTPLRVATPVNPVQMIAGGGVEQQVADPSKKLMNALESLPHPNDLIFSRKTAKAMPVGQPEIMTPMQFVHPINVMNNASENVSLDSNASVAAHRLRPTATQHGSDSLAGSRSPSRTSSRTASAVEESAGATAMSRTTSKSSSTKVSRKQRATDLVAEVADTSDDEDDSAVESPHVTRLTKARIKNKAAKPASTSPTLMMDTQASKESKRSTRKSKKSSSRQTSAQPSDDEDSDRENGVTLSVPVIKDTTFTPTPTLGTFNQPKTRNVTGNKDDVDDAKKHTKSKKAYSGTAADEQIDSESSESDDEDKKQQQAQREKERKAKAKAERERERERARMKEERKVAKEEKRQREREEREKEEARKREKEEKREQERRKREKEEKRALAAAAAAEANRKEKERRETKKKKKEVEAAAATRSDADEASDDEEDLSESSSSSSSEEEVVVEKKTKKSKSKVMAKLKQKKCSKVVTTESDDDDEDGIALVAPAPVQPHGRKRMMATSGSIDATSLGSFEAEIFGGGVTAPVPAPVMTTTTTAPVPASTTYKPESKRERIKMALAEKLAENLEKHRNRTVARPQATPRLSPTQPPAPTVIATPTTSMQTASSAAAPQTIAPIPLAAAPQVQPTTSIVPSSMNAIGKLVVRQAAHQPNTIHFLDMSRFDDGGGPLIAFRLEGSVNAIADPATSAHGHGHRNKGAASSTTNNWLHDSLQNGTKLQGNVRLSVGRDGPALFDILVRRRAVDKYTIQGVPGVEHASHLAKFNDAPHWGDHEDFRHLYCTSPAGRACKWFVDDPEKLMRLFGRGEKDYGHVYVEARSTVAIGGGGHVRRRAPTLKETTLIFLPDVGSGGNTKAEKTRFIENGYVCATWWCARQTYDEGQMAAAHAEVEMIENIEKAFEVDLLAGA